MTTPPIQIRFTGLCAQLLLLLLLVFSGTLQAQSTTNLAPRISLAGVSELVRADTLCVSMDSGTNLGFAGLSVSDTDVGAGLMHARVELELGLGSIATVQIPGLAGFPGVEIISEDPDRIRFNAPLSSVNAAFAALQYQSAGAGDTIDLIADDLQLPPLSAELRLLVAAEPGAPFSITRCRPPPDLLPGSDTGASNEDDITGAASLSFAVTGVLAGDDVQLLNDGLLVTQAVATGSSLVMVDPAPEFDATGLYAVSVNADAGSASLSVAVVTVASYTVGGTVSGLIGDGLILQNNAGDDLAILADGSFTFGAPLTDASPYAVSVLTQPTAPDQTCVVSNATGALAGANILDIVVECTIDGFTIGGSVSGLSGSGLTLQNNAGDDLSINADGGFVFPVALMDGSPFDVTVLQQPAGLSQTCSVQNGSGTVQAADVTDVAVQCVTNSFSVGGTVSGLQGSGLVLQNNLGDDLPIAADGAFTFATFMADGSTYSVTVMDQPTAPRQTCSVRQGAGVLAGSDAGNVNITCVVNYTVGGSVLGLVGSGLVLRNNASDDLAIAGDGSFTFALDLADGSPYSVSVVTQPASPQQTCRVTGGDGVLAGADVTTVIVNCALHYRVGGTVNGLIGDGLLLQNNGGDDLSIQSDGQFQFPTALEDGSDYTVTVLGQPSLPAQSCTVESGQGTLNGADVVDVAVLCSTGAFSLSVLDGNGQTADTGTPFVDLLSALLLDAQGSPVPGSGVQFAAPGTGSSAILADGVQPDGTVLTVLTDALGVAHVVAVANAEAGCYEVIASNPGSNDLAVFSLTNSEPLSFIFGDGFEAGPAGARQGGVCTP